MNHINIKSKTASVIILFLFFSMSIRESFSMEEKDFPSSVMTGAKKKKHGKGIDEGQGALLGEDNKGKTYKTENENLDTTSSSTSSSFNDAINPEIIYNEAIEIGISKGVFLVKGEPNHLSKFTTDIACLLYKRSVQVLLDGVDDVARSMREDKF